MPARLDAFGRQRVSFPQTLFDSKQLWDKAPLWWDESIVNGSGNAASTHSTGDAATTLHVEAGDTIIRQTKQHFNYQPGKGQQPVFTGILSEGGTGAFLAAGQFTATDGLFFAVRGTTLGVNVRKGSSDTTVPQSGWNRDPLDGSGPSRIALDLARVQVFYIAYEWLGAGEIQFGIYFNGQPIPVHDVTNLNALSAAYMATPNLPMRYEASSTSATVELLHECSSVLSEGGSQLLGLDHAITTDGVNIVAALADTIYALMGIRLKSTHLDAAVDLLRVEVLDEAKNDFEWKVLLNPTVAGTFTYADVTNLAVQRALGAAANVVTADSEDIQVDAGLALSGKDGGLAVAPIQSALRIGSKIDGTPDELVLAARPLGTNSDFQAVMKVRELS